MDADTRYILASLSVQEPRHQSSNELSCVRAAKAASAEPPKSYQD